MKLLHITGIGCALLLFVLLGFSLWQQTSLQNNHVLTREDLPLGARRIEHNHPVQYTDNGEIRPEMEHWATPDAETKGGPIFGVHGYRIVAIEYELNEDEIGERPVGEEDTGMSLIFSEMGISHPIRYDHVHIGLGLHNDNHDHSHNDRKNDQDTKERSFIIHYMLIPHEEEMAMGLSCS